MSETIDGSLTLAEQQSAIQFKEAKGYQLKTLKSGSKTPPTNEVEFDTLPIGQLPDLFTLVLDSVPDGEDKVWSGKIFIKGQIRQAAA